MKDIKTYWVQKPCEWPSFDDYIIIESVIRKERLFIDINEFEFLFTELFKNWKKSASKYIQILKEWNEVVGFNDIQKNPSIINDVEDTIEALKLIKGSEKEQFLKVSNKGLMLIISFLITHKKEQLTIRKE